MALNFLNDGYFAAKVGIGTETPLAKLDISTSGNTAIPGLDVVPGTSTSTVFGNTGNTVILAVGVDNANTSWLQGRQTTGTGSAFDIALNPLGGNVGIGTNDPASLLHIQGSTYNRVETYFSGAYISGFKFSDLNGGVWYDAGNDDLILYGGQANSNVIIKSGGGNTALTLDSGLNATFAGNLIIHDGSNAPYIDFVESGAITDSKARIAMDQIDTNNGQLIFSTENAGTLTTALTISQTQNATFVGNISTPVNKRISIGTWDNSAFTGGAAYGYYVNSTTPMVILEESDQSKTGYMGISGGNMYVGGVITNLILQSGSGSNALTIDSSQNATFAGAIYLLNTSARISAGGSGEVGFNYNTSATGSLVWYGGTTSSKFSVTNAGNATFAGIVETDKIFVAKGQNLTHTASSVKISQENTTKSQIRFYGADTSTAGILEFTGSSSDGSAGGIRLTINADGSSTFAGAVSGTTATFTTFSGDLNGTINTLTTAVTKGNAVNDTTVATTAFVQNVVGTIPAGLVFQGTWNASTNTPTLASGTGTTGNFYIVSVAGTTNLDGITDWEVGDWAVFIEQGASDQWEKIDNSSVLSGSGTGDSVTKWDGSGTSVTLTDGPITFSGNDSTFAGNITVNGTTITLDSAASAGYIADRANDTSGATYEYKTGGSLKWYTGLRGVSTEDFYIFNNAQGSTALLLNSSNNNATFAGTVDAQGFRTTSGSTDYSLLTRNSANTAVYIQQAGSGNIVDFRYGSQAAGQGTSAMVIDDSGNVGIGTTTPQDKLNVHDSSASANLGIKITRGSQTHGLRLGVNDSHAFLWTDQAQDLVFATNDSQRMTISSAGDVGIGKTTSLQSHKLSILKGASNQQLGLYYDETHLVAIGAKSTGDLQMYAWNGSSYANILLGMDGAAVGGNVGIGLTDPDSRLDINAGVSAITAGPAVRISKGASPVGLIAYDTLVIEANDVPTIRLGESDGTVSTIMSGDDNLRINSTDPIKFYTAGTTTGQGHAGQAGTFAMIIDNSQNVGIGTTSPGAKLQIGSATYAPNGNLSNNLLQIKSPSSFAYLTIGNSDTANSTAYIGGASGLLVLGSVTDAGVISEHIRMTSAGNVGIGTTSPDALLSLGAAAGQKFYVYSDGSTVKAGMGVDLSGSSRELSIFNSSSNGTTGNISFGYRHETGGAYTENMRITSASHVGIGTTTPLHKLVVSEGTNQHGIEFAPGTLSYIQAYDRATGSYGGMTIDTKYLAFGLDNGAEKIRFTDEGEVGIGTTGPDAPLSIIGATGKAIGASGIRVHRSDSFGQFGFFDYGQSSGTTYIGSSYTGGSASVYGVIQFRQLSNGGAAQDTMIIDASNNVGIGTTAPYAYDTTATKFHVKNASAGSGAVGEVARFEGSADADGSGGTIRLGTSNDRGMYFEGGRTSTVPYGKIGTTEYDGAKTVAITLNNSGDVFCSRTVGIATTSVTSGVVLEVAGAGLIKASTGVGDFYLGNYATGNYFRFHTNNANTYFDMNCGDMYWRQGASTRYYFYASTANMTINGTLTQNSDSRVKENIVEIDDCIGKVQAMRGVYYNRTDFNTEVTKVGVIAQEVETVLPELILESPEDGLKSVAYSELTAVLINAVKEQQEIIEDLKTRIEQLEN